MQVLKEMVYTHKFMQFQIISGNIHKKLVCLLRGRKLGKEGQDGEISRFENCESNLKTILDHLKVTILWKYKELRIAKTLKSKILGSCSFKYQFV